MNTPHLPLYEQAQELTTSKPDKIGVVGAKRAPGIVPQLINYRRLIKNARRFEITNDFIHTVDTVSRDISALENRINIARLPYPVMWLEWDCHFKVQLSFDQSTLASSDPFGPNFSEIPERMGALLQETNPETGEWVCYFFSSGEVLNAPSFTDPIGWVVKPEGNASSKCTVPPGHTALSDVYPMPPGLAALGLGVASHHSRFSVVFLPWIEQRLQMLIEPLWRMGYQAELKYQSTKSTKQGLEFKERSTSIMITMAEEQTGLLRYIITILAMMNKAPDVKTINSPSKGGHRMRGNARLPYLGHNIITLELPKDKPVTYISRLLEAESDLRRRNRAHEVRGHFRQIERGKKLPHIKCDHEPTMVEKGVGICLKCERLVKWIPTHNRGDETLGWVTHDYIVEGS